MSEPGGFVLAPPPQKPRETERTMLDRLRRRYGRTYKNGPYVGRQFVIAEKVATSPGGSHDSARIADALVLDTWKPSWHDAIHTSIYREEFREIYARLTAPGVLDVDAVRTEALRSWPGGAEGIDAEVYRREVRAAFERGAAWQSRRLAGSTEQGGKPTVGDKS